jgi:hypothetical protein
VGMAGAAARPARKAGTGVRSELRNRVVRIRTRDAVEPAIHARFVHGSVLLIG